MNIVYNRTATEKDLSMFKVMEEFVSICLNDKALFYIITIQLKEFEDKSKGASYIGLCKFLSKTPYKPIIKISDYGMRLAVGEIALSGKSSYNSFERYRYRLIFQGLAHIVRTYNDPEQFHIMTRDDKEIIDIDEDRKANKMVDEFLTKRGFFNE